MAEAASTAGGADPRAGGDGTAERSGPYSPAAAISTRMVRLVREYTGRGPTKARTTLNSNVVVVTFHDTLTKAELNLVEAGQGEAVMSMRRTFHDVMRARAVANIEELLGRRVIAALADIDPQANVAVMVFLLEEEPESGRAQVSEARVSDGSPS